MLHSLDLSDSPQTTETAETAVDEQTQTGDNRTVLRERSRNTPAMKKSPTALIAVLCLVAVAAGVGTGFGSYKLTARGNGSSLTSGGTVQQVATGTVKEGDVFGSGDEAAYKDHAKGYLEKGGIDGEGSHKLLRAGGITQTVYLTSSVTDLDKFDGMEVEIWGETFSSQKAGWLMDVGRVKVTAPNGEKPSEE